MRVLVTGGAGYIGSHTVVNLLSRGDSVVIIDNLSNTHPSVLEHIERITGKRPDFYNYDLRDRLLVENVFTKHSIDAVIHFAGFKSVGESVSNPILYYANNLESTLTLLDVMNIHGARKLVFSSSATVYGDPTSLPVTESASLHATNPYGQTKLMIEQMLQDVCDAGRWNIISLRYFNPIGAHTSGLIGENPNGIPNNLFPYINQVAVGKLKRLSIFGGDYDTPDGTGIRDYVHVSDLADAHLAALTHIDDEQHYRTYNIGVGRGVSVLQLINTFQEASGKIIPYDIVERRVGDVASCYANVELANDELGWKAKLSIAQACEDSWRWQTQNPDGYV